MSNLTNDVTALQTAIAGNLISFVQEAVILVGSLASMIFLYWKLTLLTLVIVPLVVFTINFFGSRLRRAGHDVQGKMADITSLLEEAISGIRIIAPLTAKILKSGVSCCKTTATSGPL